MRTSKRNGKSKLEQIFVVDTKKLFSLKIMLLFVSG